MKSTQVNRISRLFTLLAVIGSLLFFSNCEDNAPEKEDVPELITKVELIFTPIGGGSTVTVSATDPDGEGVQDIVADGTITLEADKLYYLTIGLYNELVQPTDPEYDITAEVEEEGDEHMFFFSWTSGLFSDPAGNGNIDDGTDPLNYLDEDDNGLPLGLSTAWTTINGEQSGTFRVLLKHQPELKTETSDATVGETDLDVSFDITVQ